MAFRTIIDGYNLLFEAGFDGLGRGPGWLDRARQRLILFLQTHLPVDQHARTLVAFDATGSAKGTVAVGEVDLINKTIIGSGIQVVFAGPDEEADDLLERLVRQHSAPKTLTVVSSDRRIRKSAIARRCEAVDSSSFLARLERERRNARVESRIERVDSHQPLDPHEVQHWLREFRLMQ